MMTLPPTPRTSSLASRLVPLVVVLVAALIGSAHGEPTAARKTWSIIIDPAAAPLERFAARELQRYLYVRTGELASLGSTPEALAAGPAFILGTKDRVPIRAAGPGTQNLAPQSYRVRTITSAHAPRVVIAGGDPLGTLYGVYAVAEKLGVRFYLSGDVIPDPLVPLDPAALATEGRPLFSVRGLQPFHDFAEGPDWWNTDDYLAHLGQMAKLRMNFLGLHTYPESDVGPEPTVWIGPPGEYDERGSVRTAYPASYHTTGRSGRGWWTYAPMRTSEFAGGAATLFDRDDFGADAMRDRTYAGQTPASAADVFNRTAAMLGTAFAEARRLGVLTCVGTETPLTIPAAVKGELARAGRNPADPAVVRELYRGMFERIGRAMPADYYWLWTPENWTWGGNRSDEYAGTVADIQAALGALRELHSPMRLATCGWVLGPQHDRSALDRLLPPDSPMSAINSSVGHVAIDRQFSRLSDRPRWAIPWLENDGNLTSPQLWAGRMRYDAADALRLGCTGLIGIHWRTRVLSPAISALAAAAWDQSWVPAEFDTARMPPLTGSGANGGHAVAAIGPVHGTGELQPFATNRIGVTAYDMLVPSGTYTVRLGFSEIAGAEPGQRVFDVKVNGALALERFDIAARHGTGQAVRIEFKDVHVSEGRLLIELVPHRGEPAIAAIELNGVTEYNHLAYRRGINCGGPELPGFEADQLAGAPRPPHDRAMPVDAFYRDFATANFGPEAAADIGQVLAEMDGVTLPMPTLWIDGPGDIRRNPNSWAEEAAKYAFVLRFEALRSQVRGSANLDRFDYWLNQFRALRLIAEIGCTAGALDAKMQELQAITDSNAARERTRTEALPLRVRLATLWTALLRTEVAAASNTGELGTLANLEQRSRRHQKILTRDDDALVKLLGCELPLAAWPENDFRGNAHIAVPTVRTSAPPGEALRVRVLLVAQQAPAGGTLHWRWLGESAYRESPFRHVARGVYECELPPLDTAHASLEYHLTAELGGEARRWPVSDRGLDQIIILAE